MIGPSPNPVFRASFLTLLPTPEALEAAEAFGDLLNMVVEQANWVGILDSDRPDEAVEVETAAADLEAVVQQLEVLASRRDRKDLPTAERGLYESAAAWSGELARVALRMHRSAQEHSSSAKRLEREED